MKSPSEFRADASFCRPISVYRHVVEVAIDTLYSSMHVQPEFYLPVFSRLPGPHLEFSCQYFPSLVERREPCRCKSGLADVVEISLCSICQPSLPARYALGVGARFGEWPANRWHTIPPLRLRPHQQFWLSSSALSHKPIHQVLSCAAPWRSLPAFAVGNVVRGTDATDICPITGQHLLPLQSPARTAIDPPYG